MYKYNFSRSRQNKRKENICKNTAYAQYQQKISNLTKGQRNALAQVCLGRGYVISSRMARILIALGLIEKSLKRNSSWDFEITNFGVHMAWCEWCTKHIKEE